MTTKDMDNLLVELFSVLLLEGERVTSRAYPAVGLSTAREVARRISTEKNVTVAVNWWTEKSRSGEHEAAWDLYVGRAR